MYVTYACEKNKTKQEEDKEKKNDIAGSVSVPLKK